MSVIVGAKVYKHKSKVETITFRNDVCLYKRSDYNDDDSIEFLNEEDRKAEAMKIVLKQQMEPFRGEQERLYINGVQKAVLRDLTLSRINYEISKIDTG